MQEQCSGMITEVKKFSTHDGPGIRTTVFLKGCPLRCSWCSNPETLSRQSQLYVRKGRCKNSEKCVSSCPKGALSKGGVSVALDRTKCDLCALCVSECNNKVFQLVGEVGSVDQVMEPIRRDRPFYGKNGGATLCGGEPLFQPEFALAILDACRNEGINTELDTSGFAPAKVADEAARLSDMVLLDIKHMDPLAHRQGTGMDNNLILENAARMARLTALRISVPLIPGFNDCEPNLRRTAKFGRAIGARAIDLNPMHILGSEKYLALDEPVPYTQFGAVNLKKVAGLADMVRSFGIEVTVGRMM